MVWGAVRELTHSKVGTIEGDIPFRRLDAGKGWEFFFPLSILWSFWKEARSSTSKISVKLPTLHQPLEKMREDLPWLARVKTALAISKRRSAFVNPFVSKQKLGPPSHTNSLCFPGLPRNQMSLFLWWVVWNQTACSWCSDKSLLSFPLCLFQRRDFGTFASHSREF